MKNILQILITAALLFSLEAKPQNTQIDSLQELLKIAQDDTSHVNTLVALSKELINTGVFEKAKEVATEALLISRKINFKKGEQNAYNNIGNIYLYQSDFPEALKNYAACLKIGNEIGDKKGIATIYNNIGIIFSRQGNYPEALKNYFASLKLKKEIGDQKGVAQTYANIGLVYDAQGDFAEALNQSFAALKIQKEIGDKKGISDCYNSFGYIYSHMGKYPEALENFFSALKLKESIQDMMGIAIAYDNIGIIYSQIGNYSDALPNYLASLKIKEQIGDKSGVAKTYNNMGFIYLMQGNYSGALKSQFAALKIQEEIGEERDMAISYSNIGNIYEKLGNLSEALKNVYASLNIANKIGDKKQNTVSYINLGSINIKLKNYSDAKMQLKNAFLLANETGSAEDIMATYSSWAELDSATGNWEDAYLHHKLFILYRDSLFNEENTKKLVQSQMNYDFDKKETVAKAEQDKKDAVAAATFQKQGIVKNSFIGGFAIVLVFAGVFFTQRNRISKEKKRSDVLLLNILPAETAEELKRTGSAESKDFNEVTVLFTDFKNFTALSERLNAKELVSEINYCYSAFDTIITKYGIEKIKTIGDSYMCAGGLPVANKTNADDAVKAALEIRDFMLSERQKRAIEGKSFFEIRIGLHSGPVVAGIVGIKKFAYDIWGDTVNIASRMESNSEPGKVNISGATYELVKNKFTCTHRGKIEAKNKGMIDMYFVEG